MTAEGPFSAKVPQLTSGLLLSFQENSFQLLCPVSLPSDASPALFAHEDPGSYLGKNPGAAFKGGRSPVLKAFGLCGALGGLCSSRPGAGRWSPW